MPTESSQRCANCVPDFDRGELLRVVILLHANDVASVIIARSGSWLDATSLQKLLYYVQAWHLAIADEPLFDEKVKAWKNGPVVPQVWHDRKDQSTRRSVAQSVGSVDLDDFSSDLIDLVIAGYGSMSPDELSALTHVEAPWCEARGDTPDGAASAAEISRSSMARFYRAHRRLGGRTAADLAAGGLHLRAHEANGPVDIDALLSSFGSEYDEPAGADQWGGANLHHTQLGA